MSDNRFDRDDDANNNGPIKSWGGLALFLGAFIGFMIMTVILSHIPSLKWLGIALVGLFFMAGGLFFLKASNSGSPAPWIAVFVGAVIMYASIKDKFFPESKLGDKGTGAVLIVFALIMVIYPFAKMAFAKSRCKETVEATVIRVDSQVSSDVDGHHMRSFRPVYEFMYSGRQYTVMNRVFSSGRHPMVGEARELIIDENDPEVFYDLAAMKPRITTFIIPAILLALAVYLIVAG